jgi:hypothetical protein
MCGAIPPLPNTPSWRGAQSNRRDNFTFTFKVTKLGIRIIKPLIMYFFQSSCHLLIQYTPHTDVFTHPVNCHTKLPHKIVTTFEVYTAPTALSETDIKMYSQQRCEWRFG